MKRRTSGRRLSGRETEVRKERKKTRTYLNAQKTCLRSSKQVVLGAPDFGAQGLTG